LAATALVLTIPPYIATSAYAQGATCSSFNGNGYWDGVVNDHDTWGVGVRADLWVTTDQVCDSSTSSYNQNFAQSTIFDSVNTTQEVAAGEVRHYGQPYTYAFANGNQLGTYTIHYSPTSYGRGINFQMDLQPTVVGDSIYVTAQVLNNVGDPLASGPQVLMCCWSSNGSTHEPMKDRFWGGTTWLNSDVPGTTTYPIKFRNQETYDGLTPGLVTSDWYPCSLNTVSKNDNPSHWDQAILDCLSENIWTYKE